VQHNRMSTGRFVLTLLQTAAALVVAAVLAGSAWVALSADRTPSWTSSATFLVGAPDIPRGSSLGAVAPLARTTLPSLVRVAVSGSVLADAERELDVPPGTLDGRVVAAVPDDLSLLDVRVTGPDPGTARAWADAVATSLQETVGELTGESGAQLSLVDPPREPRFPSTSGLRTSGLVGGAAGLGAVALLLGLREAARPRVRSRTDVTGLGLPVVLHPRRRVRPRASAVARTADLLTWHLPPAEARRVAEGLTDRTLPTRDGDVVVVRGGRTTVAELRRVAPGAAVVVMVAGRAVRWSDAAADRVRHLVGTGGEDRRRMLSAAVPMAVLALAGLNPRLPGGLDAAALLAVALLPVWSQHLRDLRGARVLLGLGAVALGAGMLLALASRADHDWTRVVATAQAMGVIGGLGIIGIVCWARDLAPLWCPPVAFGLGALIGAVPDLGANPNPFKFLVAFPLALVVLGACEGWGRRWAAVLACVVLAGLCAVNDSRSALAFFLATAAAVLWQTSRSSERSLNRLGTVGTLLAAGTAGYLLATDLLLSGALGAGITARTRQQVDQSGSLLLGGRPEWTGTVRLMTEQPTGFGLGTMPTGADVTTIKEGFASLRIPTADGYIENYLTGDGFELHSIIADLWVWLGIPGLAFGLVATGLVVWGLADRLATSRAPAVLVFLGLYSLWYLAFGPLPANMPEVAMTIGLLLVRVHPRVPGTVVEAAPARGSALASR